MEVVMQLDPRVIQKMEAQTVGLPTKSAKIRALGRAGCSRREIADFLGIRYQHVRNVLVDEERAKKGAIGASDRDLPAGLETKSAQPRKDTIKLRLGQDGQLAIPSYMRAALDLKEGDTVWLTLEDGEIRVADAAAVTRRIQAWARTIKGLGSVDDFLTERRRDYERELRDE
jgi:AbrB family looped-hinge helix DNA binding protein